MAQPSYYATGTTPNLGDTRLKRWTRILGVYQNRPGAKASNNPVQTNTVRQIKKKILSAIGTFTGGGGGGGTGDPDVDAFVTCANITDPTQIAAVLTLVTGLKSDGTWSNFDAIYPFVGGNPAAHSCNLKKAGTFSITWHGGVTHNSNGVTGDGSTGYGDTGFNPTSAGGNFSLNAGSLGIYCKTAAPTGAFMIGAWQNLGSNTNTRIDNLSTSMSAVGFSSDNAFSITTSTFKGQAIAVRTSNGSMTAYAPDGTIVTNSSYTANTLVNLNIYILSANINGAAQSNINANYAFTFIGGSFTGGQVTGIKSRILTFETTLNRA